MTGDAGLADLVPIPTATGGFCRSDQRGLIVIVCNQGTGPAGPSTTTVDFGQFGRVDVPTPALEPLACTVVTAAIPEGCFDPDCNFSITVDSAGVVTESDKDNNTVTGVCIG